MPLSHTFGQLTKADTILATATEIADYILYQNHDTSYIRNYANKVSVKLLTLSKYNTFHLWDQSNNTSISYRPDLGVNFGIGAAYKWFALDISTSLGFSEDNISDSKYRDIQGRVLTSKHYLRFRYQYYLGYKIAQISGYEGEQLDVFETRQDIRTMQFGLQYLYAFNYGKFSLKAPFAMNERQKKSAGFHYTGPDPGNWNKKRRLQDSKPCSDQFCTCLASKNHECNWLQRAALLYGPSDNFHLILAATGQRSENRYFGRTHWAIYWLSVLK